MTTFAVTVLGNNAALPAQGRHPTSQVLHYHDRNYLLDCGEGTQMQMQLYRVKNGKLNHAFITHLHGDHYYGLIGLLTSMHLNQRKTSFRIFAPEGMEEIIRTNFKYSQTEINYNITFTVVDPTHVGKIGEDDYLEFHSFPLHHRISCCGYIFREKPRPAKFRKELLKKHGVKGTEAIQAIKRGEDFITENGLVVKSEEFTYPQLIVEHEFARKRCLEAYKKALNNK